MDQEIVGTYSISIICNCEISALVNTCLLSPFSLMAQKLKLNRNSKIRLIPIVNCDVQQFCRFAAFSLIQT